jgi:hypothetical protein
MPDTIVAGGHTAEMDWDGALTALEARAEIDSLEDLQQRRRQLMPEYAALRALHGPNGKWDAKRKQYLEAMKIKARAACQQDGTKVTEGLIDAMAHAQDEYIQFIDAGIEGATRYVVVDNEITDLAERIENRKSCLYVFGGETRLQR